VYFFGGQIILLVRAAINRQTIAQRRLQRGSGVMISLDLLVRKHFLRGAISSDMGYPIVDRR
jgi:hypothetical protein